MLHKLFSLFVGLFFVIGIAAPVYAITYTWDPIIGDGLPSDGAGVWDTTSTRWTTDSGATNAVWLDANDAVVGSGAGSAGTITIGGATSSVTINSITFNSPLAGNYTIAGGTLFIGAANTSFFVSNISTVSSVISGGGSLNKLNASQLTLSGNNTYTGATIVTGGILTIPRLGNAGLPSPLGASTSGASNLRLAGGILQYSGAASTTDRLFTIAASSNIQNNGAGAIQFTNPGAIAHTNLATARTLSLSGSNTGANTILSTIDNAGPGVTAVAKTGTGAWLLTGLNTYTGTTTISQGTLTVSLLANGGAASHIGSAPALGPNIIFGGGVLNYTGPTISIDRQTSVVAASTLNVSAPTTTLTVSGVMSGAGNFTKTGSGILELSGVNTRTGVTAINGGVLRVSTINNGGIAGNISQATAASANISFNTGGVLQYSGATASTNRGMTFTGAGNIDIVSNALTVSGVLVGAGAMEKRGSGTLVLSGVNTRTGITTMATGTLSVGVIGDGGVAGHLGAAISASGNIVFRGGTLRYTGVTSSTNRGITFTATGTIDIASNTLTDTGTLVGSGRLIKIGDGTLELLGANTRTGVTEFASGTISMNVLGNGGVSGGLGAATNAPANLIFTGGRLRYAGATSTSDRGMTLVSSGTLEIVNSSLTLSSPIIGSGELYKTGTGTLIMAGLSAYTGQTFVMGGLLTVTGDLLSSALVSIESNGILSGTGVVGAVNIANVSSSKIFGGLGAGAIGTLVTGVLTFGGSGSRLLVQTNGISTSLVTSTGAVNLNAVTIDVQGALPDGVYTVLSGASVLGSVTTGTLSTGAVGMQNIFVVTPTSVLLYVDQTADAAPGVPDLQSLSDTGASSTDNITSTSTPIFDISCSTGSQVRLYSSSTLLASGICSLGSIALTSSALVDGTYSAIGATQVDLVGNVSVTSSLLTITTDSTQDPAPGVPDLQSLSDTGASSTDNITSTSTPIFDISCVSSNTVELYQGLTLLGSGMCVGASAMLTSSVLVDGTYSMYARQSDLAGNISPSSSPLLLVVVDSVASVAPGTPVLQSGSDTGISNTDEVTADTTPTFDVSCISGETVSVYATTTSLASGVCVAGTVSITTPVLGDGTFAFTAVQADLAGNRSVTSSALSVVIDTIAPTVTVNQGPSQLDPVSVGSIQFRALFSEPIATSTFGLADISLSLSTATSVSIVSITEVAPFNATTFDVHTLALSQGTIVASLPASLVSDTAGNLNAASTFTDQSVTIGTFAPGSPVGLTATPGNAQISLSWTASSSDGGSAVINYFIQYRLSGAPTFSVFSHATSVATSIIVTGLTNGASYEFQVSAVNVAGTSLPSQLASATPVAPILTSGGGGGGSGGGSGVYPLPIEAPNPDDIARLAIIRSLGFSLHDLVKLPDDRNPKTQEDSAVYYLAADGRRHAFPDPKVFASWYCDFSQVKIMTANDLMQIPLGRNVFHRPGVRMVKFPTDPKVYLVQMSGVLRPLISEAQAIEYAGTAWAKKVSDVADTFYNDYSIGAPIGATDNKIALDQSSSYISGEFGIRGYRDPRVVHAASISCPASSQTTSSSQVSLADQWIFSEFQPGFRFQTTLQVSQLVLSDVRALQEVLTKVYPQFYPEKLITGKYGAFTYQAVLRLQASVGLEQTGVIDLATRRYLNQQLASKE